MITVYGANTTLDELREIPVVRPDNAGQHWRGIQHGELVDTILDEVALRGWDVGEQQYSVHRDGADLVGAVDILPGGDIEAPPGVGFGLGFMTSNARRRALKLYVGGRVFVCNNGMASGTIVCRKKHSLHTDLTGEIERSLDRYADEASKLTTMVACMRETHVDSGTVSDLLAEAGERDMMPKKYLWDVSREFYRPSHPEHGEGTVWTLTNAFTEIVKRNPAHSQLSQMANFHRMTMERAGLQALCV
jgi:hypothetical protein